MEVMEGGWVVACAGSHTVEFVGGNGRSFLGNADGGYRDGDGGLSGPISLALVPGLGLVVREFGNGGRLQVFSTPDMVAMRRMAPIRVSWMVAAARAIFRKSLSVS